jgi:NAD(P)-dependent dehydrogenase (short-subunit alcohol dehydrogenase family)
MVPFIKRIEEEFGPIEVAVYNVGGNVRFGISDTTSRVFFKVWEMCCFGGFLMGREVSNYMRLRERGTIIFTGATASVRGGDGYAAFAAGKHGLRALAQSMARELGPEGIHVGHVVIDGAIDTAWIKEMFPDRYAQKDKDGILDPVSIAETYWLLHTQSRTAWTFEMDLRPWTEKW